MVPVLMEADRAVRDFLWQLFFWCAWRRTFLMGESPQSALVVGRI